MYNHFCGQEALHCIEICESLCNSEPDETIIFWEWEGGAVFKVAIIISMTVVIGIVTGITYRMAYISLEENGMDCHIWESRSRGHEGYALYIDHQRTFRSFFPKTPKEEQLKNN